MTDEQEPETQTPFQALAEFLISERFPFLNIGVTKLVFRQLGKRQLQYFSSDGEISSGPAPSLASREDRTSPTSPHKTERPLREPHHRSAFEKLLQNGHTDKHQNQLGPARHRISQAEARFVKIFIQSARSVLEQPLSPKRSTAQMSS
ncbi:hypothetical protein J6590_044269 [Homalodisca vitripennis]|nr:hypothetical protein J6590_044269 [Homalodisca vitripennis]